MTIFTASKRYHAFGEQANYSGNMFEYSKLPKTAYASVSERSFGSNDSKWSVMRYYPTACFDEHIAGGVGDVISVRSNITDNLLNELDDLMPGTVPNFEASTESDHPRQMNLYLENLDSDLWPTVDVEENESTAVVRIVRQFFGLDDAWEGFNIVPEVNRLLSADNVVALLRRLVQLCILIALAIVTTMLPQIFGVDLPDFFMHAMFLLFMALIATVVMI